MVDEPLQAIGLVKRYGVTEVLGGIHLAVPPGRVVGLLGPNGTGKSTAMRCLAGITPPSGGSVSVDGGDPFLDPAVRSRLGFVPDVGGTFPRLTGREHLELVATLYGYDVGLGLALADRLGLVDALDRRAGSYSHGMTRKLTVAMALAHAPAVLLLDEPFDGVDPIGVRAIRELMADAASDGAAVLCSTHLLDAAARVCDELRVLACGSIVASGTPEELAARFGGDLEAAYVALLEVHG